MNPNTDQRSMRVYASDNTQYRTEPNEEQSRNGVVPLDSLPAAWWNWLWNEITSNNNNALLSITDLRTEIGNVLTNAGITASAQVTNQLAQAIIVIHQRKPFFDDQHNPVPGSVISSSSRNSVSVDGSTGQMTVNALSDWASQDSVKTVIDNIVNGGSGSIASLEQDISDLNQKTGTLANLTTTDKSNLVSAINEVDSHADNKIDKVSPAVAGDFSVLDANGNLTDSGITKDVIPSGASSSNKLVTEASINEDAFVMQHFYKTSKVFATSSSVVYYKICSYTTSHLYPFIVRLEGQRVNTTICVQEVSATFYQNNISYVFNRINTPIYAVQSTESTRAESSYLIVDANNDIWVAAASYSRVKITVLAATAVAIDGTSGTPVEAYKIDGYTHTSQLASQSDLTPITADLNQKTGNLANLTTTDKSNLVAAINEVNDKATPAQYSTSEFDTKKKWIDGKQIYGRVLTDLSIRFSQNTSFPTSGSVNAFVVFNNTLYVGTSDRGIYTSTDGATFTQNTSFPTSGSAKAFVVFNNTLYVGTLQGIYTSTDGVTFTQNTSFSITSSVYALTVFNNTLYVGTWSRGIYTSTDGATFTQNTSFPTAGTVYAFTVFNGTLYVGTAQGIYISIDGMTFTQNTSFSISGGVNAFVVFNNTLYVGTSARGIYASTDGMIFTQNTSFRSSDTVYALTVFNNTLYVGTLYEGTWDMGIFTSTDGVTFIRNKSFPYANNVDAFVVFNNTLYVGTSDRGIYTTPGLASATTLSNVSELLFTQIRSSAGPLGLKSAYIDNSNHLVVEGDGTPTQAIIEYTKTT